MAYFLSWGILAWAMWSTRGHYEPKGVLALMISWWLALFPYRGKIPSWLPWVTGILFCFFLQRDLRLLFLADKWANGLRGLALLGAVGFILQKRWFAAGLGITLGGLFDLNLFIPLATPNPQIDVFVNTKEAIQFLTQGKPVYSGGYTEIYGGKYGYAPGFNYWPTILYYLTPFQVLFGDLRWGLVAAHLGSVAVLYRYFSKSVGLMWLALPIGPFVLEQSWNEPLLVVLAFFFCRFVVVKKIPAAGICLGALLASKQYLLPLGALSLLWVWRVYGTKSTLKLAGIAVGVAALTFIPFLLREPEALYLTTVKKVLDFPFREDSLNFTTFAFKKGWGLQPTFRRVFLLGFFLSGAFAIYRRPDAATWSWALGLFYLTTFTFGNHAFCNYYYWVLGLGALHLAICLNDRQAPREYVAKSA